MVGVTNKLVAGVLIQQKRNKIVPCGQGTLFSGFFFEGTWRNTKLHNKCQGNVPDSKSYGVDPVFLSTSPLYNSIALQQRTLLYDVSDKNAVNQETGFPYGFRYRNFQPAQMDGFFMFIDNNMPQRRAANMVDYLVNGFFIDAQTKTITVTMLFYNAFYGHFTLVMSEFEYDEGGYIKHEYTIKNFNGSPYQTTVDFARFIFEMIFLGLLFTLIVFEALDCYAESTSERGAGFYIYITNFWQIVDLLSLLLFVSVFYIWFGVLVPAKTKFTPKLRYNVYNDLNSIANWANDVNMGQYHELALMYYDAIYITDTMKLYMQANGFCILFVLCRILKLLDFQPRLGMVTRTMSKAMTDLLHYFGVLGLVLFVFVVMSYYLFGSCVDSFRTFGMAFNANFDMLMGSTDYNEAIMREYSIMGPVFFYSFIIIVFFLLLNILLAILVESYMKVVDETKNSMSVTEEMWSISSAWYRSHAWGRAALAKRDGDPDAWMANHYASSEEILEMMGPPPEDHYDAQRRVIEVEISEGKWLDASVSSIVKALQTHPDTKHMNPEDMTRIACTMVFRFGQVEKESVEESVASLFTPEEIVSMAQEMVKQNGNLKSERPTQMEEGMSKLTNPAATSVAWPVGGGVEAEVSLEMLIKDGQPSDDQTNRGCNAVVNPRSWLF